MSENWDNWDDQVFDHSQESCSISSETVTDEQCRDDPKLTSARYCFSCRKVIYMRSRLPEDAYEVRNGYYHHLDCSKAE